MTPTPLAPNRGAAAWGLRLHLSHVVNAGGSLLTYNGGRLPADVTAALGTAGRATNDLDNLKGDEERLAEWRAEQARAIALNARLLGRNA